MPDRFYETLLTYCETLTNNPSNKGGYKQFEQAPPCPNRHKGNGLLDVYLDPLRVIKCGEDETINNTAVAFSEPYTNGFIPKIFVKHPIFTPDTANDEILQNNSLIVVDNNSSHPFLDEIRAVSPIITDETGYSYKNNRYDGKYCIMQIVSNPWNPSRNILYINCNDTTFFSKNLFTRKVVIPSYTYGRHPFWNNDALIFDGKEYSYILDFGMDIATVN